jgi:hypothetical protein
MTADRHKLWQPERYSGGSGGGGVMDTHVDGPSGELAPLMASRAI